VKAPYVSALVQVKLANRRDWRAAIVTSLDSQRRQLSGGAWVEAVSVMVFHPHGGTSHAGMVGRLAASAEPDELLEYDVWRWAPEVIS
jgi:hypothetical protein